MSDCAPSGAAADASATTSGTNATRFMTDLPFRFRIPQSAFRNFLAPLAHPLVVQHRHDASLLQPFDARRTAVRLAIEHGRHTRIDDQLGAHHARRGADEHDLVARVARGLHEGIHLGVNAPAAPRHRRVALVRQSPRVPVVADREHVLEPLVGDHGPDLEAGAGGALGQDRKSTRLNSSHGYISYAVFCLKKKKKIYHHLDVYYTRV